MDRPNTGGAVFRAAPPAAPPGERRSPGDDLVELPDGTLTELLAEAFERLTVLEARLDRDGSPPLQWKGTDHG